ncbi:beta-lactamase family protein [Cystobacter fuscus]|nr:beta-lactamase family protein [Cystobacter fuscus]
MAATLALGTRAEAEDYREITRRFATEHGFNGVVLVGRGRHVEDVQTFGLADAEAHVPVTPRTRFEVGSISKWVASIVVLKLVDQGKLSLDAPITTYLPDYRADTGAQLTLRRLMSHSSGVPNQIIAAHKADPSIGRVELEQMEAVRRYASGDLAFQPGEAWDYSHSNWIIVKALVERVSGKSYAVLVRDFLTRPLGLKHSGIHSGDLSKVPDMARGYARLTPTPERKVSPTPDFMAMAGGYSTTAEDLLKLMDGVLDGKVLTPASREALMTVLVPEQHYALGGRTRLEKIAGAERRVAWESGSTGGFRVLARRVLADGHTVIVMSNTSFDQAKLGELGDTLLPATYP